MAACLTKATTVTAHYELYIMFIYIERYLGQRYSCNLLGSTCLSAPGRACAKPHFTQEDEDWFQLSRGHLM